MTAPSVQPALATPQEVAEYRRTTVGQLKYERYQGTGPDYIKNGRRVFYYWKDVYDWLEGNKVRLSVVPVAQSR